jgi:DNA mismatch repair protein MutL
VSKIRVLSEQLSNRIAAGEVIERPASVVKELVENSIDAGASRIGVTVEKAGQKLIAVSDDGSGMDADDALLCLEPHATAKIHQEEDIDHIVTLGFRGEALPSIASVSRFTLRTRLHDTGEGTEVIVNGGKAIHSVPVGCAPGTEIQVRDLFFNTPARRKFMRSAATEERQIQEMMYQLALPYPGISFELTVDGTRVFSSPGAPTLESRITAFFGKTFMAAMLPVNFSSEDVRIEGFISMHGFTRSSRREQRTFVNGRSVESPGFYRGVREGYGGMVEVGRFPPVILFLTIDPYEVDVNVHPAKREVRFRQEYKLSGMIAEAIRNALRQSPAPTVNIDPAISLRSLLESTEVSYVPSDREQAVMNFGRPEIQAFEYVAPSMPPLPSRTAPAEEVEITVSHVPEESPGEGEPVFPGSGRVNILGFLDRSYLLATADNGLLVIDQHAAHERVLFERLLRDAGKGAATQKLLLPITLELSRAEAAYIGKNSEVFEKLGFDIAPLSSNTVMICAVPPGIRQENIGGVIRDMLSELMDDSLTGRNQLDVIARCACKAAVKAHDFLTLEEARGLIAQMAQCELPFSCPHGRPTIINISIAELEKRFGRR